MIQLHGILLSLGYLARASLSMTDVADAESIRLNVRFPHVPLFSRN